MRLKKSISKNSVSLSIIADITTNGKRSTKIVEPLGNLKEISEKYGVDDPMQWAKDYVEELNGELKKENRDIMIKYSTSKKIKKGLQQQFNGGYLFLQEIYYDLQLNKICDEISKKYKFEYDLNSILSRLIFGRILFPCSKLATYESSKKYIEQPNFELHHIYRALEILAKESDFIQSQLYNNSIKIYDRNDSILYYDCTNYYFEINEADGLKQYGKSKENRPNPIVQMGLFTDGDGIPLSFTIFSGEGSEQITMKPLEEKILSDFNLSKFIVCTDAGLSSTSNRNFNNVNGRAFITTQSVKKLKAFLKEWMFEDGKWLLPGSENNHNGKPLYYNLEEIDEKLDLIDAKEYKTEEDYNYIKQQKERVYYKERWIKEDDLEQKFIVTFSFKFRNYLRSIRNEQINKAMDAILNKKKIKTTSTSYKRLIKIKNVTSEGEEAKDKKHEIDIDKIMKEQIYDGYYGVCTNLEDSIEEIIKINKRRWHIEECFRIMKSEFKARPVFLKNDDRIEAHFMTCFLALTIFRLLEKRLKSNFTCRNIIDTLKDFNFLESPTNGYIPTYTRNDISDAIHDNYGFRTDYEIVDKKNMKKIIQSTKKRNSTQKIKEKYKREPQ